MKKDKYAFWKNTAVQSILASLLCIFIGLLIGYIVLLFINPAGAWNGITTILKNFFTYPSHQASLKYFGSTLVKTAPLLLCALSIQFSYKVGLFNIGAAGQYVAGAGACLFAALAWDWPWYACLIAAMLAGALFGALSGVLKAYCNVNEVISGIMLLSLESGACDVVCTDQPTAMAAVVAYPDLKMLDFTGTSDNYAVDEGDVNIGVSIAKGNSGLVDACNSVLSGMLIADSISVQFRSGIFCSAILRISSLLMVATLSF